ncbi:MAG TPA: hypothetical protein VKR30_06445 [Candidatus Limnocylindrales bacterium]|nr:hypothetical protein [Candidatus Limnocylindrales bacterium]
MHLLSLHRKLALSGALVAALTIGGAAAASTPPRSTNASPTAVSHASAAGITSQTDTGNDSDTPGGSTVSAAAQSALTGGAHDNHGGYVSCVARGGSNCTSTTPTLPSHGQPINLPGAAPSR